MSIVAPGQSHFDGGEISPLLQGRIDSDRYKASLALCKNWFPTIQGALTRRPGSAYVGQVKFAANKTRLVPFIYSTTQAYVLEFGANYIRFWANYGQVVNGGTPIEVATTYTQAEIFNLKFAQSADVLYIVHPAHPPAKLSRLTSISFRLDTVTLLDGPYLPYQSILGTAGMTISATSGSASFACGTSVAITNMVNNGAGPIRCTVVPNSAFTLRSGDKISIGFVSGTVEAIGDWIVSVISPTQFDLVGSAFVNTFGGAGSLLPFIFTAVKDIGRAIRLQTNATHWGWGIITAIADPRSATIALQTTQASVNVSTFQLGIYSVGNGYPSAITLHQDRLVLGSPTAYPQRLDLSRSSDYENFAITFEDGSVGGSHSVGGNLNSNDVNAIQWFVSTDKGLMSGTVSSEWVIRPSNVGSPLGPSNFGAERSTRVGSTSIQAIAVGKSTMFVQRGARKLRELHYFYDTDGYRATDLTELAEHITGTGVSDMAFQLIPISCLWLLKLDGTLVGMTYDRDISQLRTGWHQHVLGGFGDASGGAPVIESITVIPSPDGTKDDLWMAVKRYVNGVTIRSVEYMTKVFEGIDDASHANFVDFGITYDVPVTMLNINAVNPASVACVGHGLSNGNLIRIDGVNGMNKKVNGVTTNLVNGQWFSVALIDANNLTLQNPDTLAAIDATTYTAGLGGTFRKLITNISGLTYMANETVQILADGAVLPDQVVSNTGTLTLPLKAAVVTIGYAYNSDAQLLRAEAGARNGTALGKTRRTHRVGVLVYRSQALQIGKSFSNLDPVEFRTQGVDHNTRASSYFSGIASQGVDFDYDFDNQLCVRVAQPVPCTILGIMPQLETQDRG